MGQNIPKLDKKTLQQNQPQIILLNQFLVQSLLNILFYLVIMILSPTLNSGPLGFISISLVKAELSGSTDFLSIE